MSSSEADRIEADIAATRDRLNDTIDQIQGRLTVSGLVDEVMGSSYVPRFQNGPDLVLGLLRRHPLPMMLAAAGVGWLIYRMNRQAAALPTIYEDDGFGNLPALPATENGPVARRPRIAPPAIIEAGPPVDIQTRRSE